MYIKNKWLKNNTISTVIFAAQNDYEWFFLFHVYLFLNYWLITIIIRTNYENFHVATKNYLTGICILPAFIHQNFSLAISTSFDCFLYYCVRRSQVLVYSEYTQNAFTYP